ncbi:MAG: dihydropteroate synthase [Fimbriimonadaceae bacterium]|nr:dihydropteroate synthase [Fimbriimonadaceae bacterium]
MSGFELPKGRPALMGILNVTPDSFSDGGRYLDSRAAVARGREMVRQGADVIDVGGESTRPGAEPVDAEEESRRVVPVVAALSAEGIAVSVDTTKAIVARRCLQVGATVINDVSAFGDPEMAGVCAGAQCSVCLMHRRGEPRTMQRDTVYEEVVEEVLAFLVERARSAEQEGVAKDRIWIDPGIGFGKSVAGNLELLAATERFVATGYPVLVGVSRKSFLGAILGTDREPAPAEARVVGSVAAQVVAQRLGARVLRVHDVREARDGMVVASAIERAGQESPGARRRLDA